MVEEAVTSADGVVNLAVGVSEPREDVEVDDSDCSSSFTAAARDLVLDLDFDFGFSFEGASGCLGFVEASGSSTAGVLEIISGSLAESRIRAAARCCLASVSIRWLATTAEALGSCPAEEAAVSNAM